MSAQKSSKLPLSLSGLAVRRLDEREEGERENFPRFREWARALESRQYREEWVMRGRRGGGGQREDVRACARIFRTGCMSTLPLSKNGRVYASFASL
jgi:hypothetical protein